MAPLVGPCHSDRARRKACASRLRGYTPRTTTALPKMDIGSLRRELGQIRPIAKTAARPWTISTITTAPMRAIPRRTLPQPRPNFQISSPCPRNDLGTRLTDTCSQVRRSRLSEDPAGTPRSAEQSLSPICAIRRRQYLRWQATSPHCQLNSRGSNRQECPTAHSPTKDSPDRLPARACLQGRRRTALGCSLPLREVPTPIACPLIPRLFAQDSCRARW